MDDLPDMIAAAAAALLRNRDGQEPSVLDVATLLAQAMALHLARTAEAAGVSPLDAGEAAGGLAARIPADVAALMGAPNVPRH